MSNLATIDQAPPGVPDNGPRTWARRRHEDEEEERGRRYEAEALADGPPEPITNYADRRGT